ncbi:MAG: hypothetical protein DMF56_21605 [Acidobacteria bacterium]|nr:MAG: hypothetical protein DMF56_21605 [Acidobacteriota bacterium]
MKKAFFAAAALAAAGVPTVVAIVMHFGCCALPFHQMAHKLMPLCHAAMNAMAGDEHREAPANPTMKPAPVKRITGVSPSTTSLASITAQPTDPIVTPAAYRSFISQGALRCDRDVGLHLLVETFRI